MIEGFEIVRPLVLYGGLLALPIAAAHLYRKRRLRVVVPFLPLLREVAAPVRSFGGLARLAEAVRLLLRIGALAALVLVAAGLRRTPTGPTEPDDLVLVLDADVTQRADEGVPGGSLVRERFDESTALAAAHLRASGDGRVALVLAGTSPTVLVPPTRDREAAVRALEPLDPAAGTTDLAAALATARTLRSPDRRTRIVVVTARALPADAPDVEVAAAGRATEDVGFAEVSTAPASEGRAPRVRFVVRATADADLPCRATTHWLAAPEKPVDERELVLAPGVPAEIVLDVAPPKEGGVLVARIEPAARRDAFAENDVVAVAIAPPSRPSILVVHGGTPRPFLRALLDAMGDAIDREASGFVPSAQQASAAPRDLVIYDGTGPAAEGAATGPAIHLAPFPAGGRTPFRVRRTVVEPLVWRAAADHPLLRGVDLSTAYVAAGATLEGDGVEGVAFADGEPIVAEGGPPGGRWVAFGLDPDGSDLPVRAALPILLKNAIRRLVLAPLAPLAPVVRAGEPIRARAPLGGPWTLAFMPLAAPRVGAREWARRPVHAPGEAPGAPTLPPRVPLGGPWRVEALGPDAPGPIAPAGGPWLVTLLDAAGRERPATRTVALDLDPARTIRPARAPTPFPPPIPVPSLDRGDGLASILLLGAAAALLCDLLLGALAARGKFARTPARA